MTSKTLLQDDDDTTVITCNIRAKEIKRYFIIIGCLCVTLVILLFVLCQIGIYEQIETDLDISQPTRAKRSVNSIVNFEKSAKQLKPIKLAKRKRRQVLWHQSDFEIYEAARTRRKRLSEDLKHFEAEFERCKKLKKNDKKCEEFYKEIIQISNLMQENMSFMTEIYKKYENVERSDMHLVEDVHPVPRFHEELEHQHTDDRWNGEKTKTILDVLHQRERPGLMPAMQPDSSPDRLREKNDNDKVISPLKNPNFDASGQILQLCDQINRQSIQSDRPSQVNNLPGPTSTGFVTNNVQPHSFNPNPQNFPVQQQQVFSPPPQQFSYRSNPVCFYPSPPVQPQLPVVQSVILPQQFMNPVPQNVNPVNQNGRIMFVTAGGQQFGATSPSGQGFIQLSNQPQVSQARTSSSSNPYHCTDPNSQIKLQQQQQQQQQQQPQQLQSPHQVPRYFADPKNVPQESDILYPTFVGPFSSLNVTNPLNLCKTGEISCVGSNQCIPNEKWCDNVVDCIDSSDETACSCTSRIDSDKICDGYLDCPMGADEIGCFGCDKFSYSCFNSREEYLRSQHLRVSMCYTANEKCDGFHNCLNGKDEEDCSMLVGNVGMQTSFMVPHTDGILHRNYRGKWYPVCENPHEWAREACEAEIGAIETEPTIDLPDTVIPGPFISKTSSTNDIRDLSEQIRFVDSCELGLHKPLMVRVKCPEMKCGSIARKPDFALPKLRIRDEDDRFKRDDEDFIRIVGGDRSGPHSWPYIVALFRDGSFHCGGTIHTPNWVISAAHCVARAGNHYYEVHAGLLRRFSHAPEVQVAVVSQIIVNSGYKRLEMANDLSLLRLKTPLQFNRWVRPICLPSPDRVSSVDDPAWTLGPHPGSVCTAVGWGATRERGPSPDNLKEVNVPIMKSCKHLEDVNGNEICAGEKEGGRDACQGDSGGPLFCQSATNPNEHYLAGIVSHGEGCARRDEPGVYTRVSLYVDWLNQMENSQLSETATPTITVCPGFKCAWSGRCISHWDRCNQIVDCLGGDDELDCGVAEGFVGATKIGPRRGRQPDELPDGASKSDIAPPPPVTETVPLPNTTIKVEPILTTTPRIIVQPPQPIPVPEVTTTIPVILTTTPKKEFIGPATEPIPVHEATSVKVEPVILTSTPIVPVSEPTAIETTTPVRVVIDPNLSPLDDPENSGPIKDHGHQNITPEDPLHEIFPKVQTFECKKINQTLSIELRCDGFTDCEDTTDEQNCTCRETLHFKQSHLICNGEVDCLDGTDEKDCLICAKDEYACRKSKKCVLKTARCDGTVDCAQKEDEANCVALTDGQSVIYDSDLRPRLNHKGIVSHNVHGSWTIMCVNRAQIQTNAKLANEICTMLDFSGYSFHNVSRILEDGTLLVNNRDPKLERDAHEPINKHILPNFRLKRDTAALDPTEVVVAPRACWALYVECIPHSALPITDPKPDDPPKKPDMPNQESEIKPVVQPDAVPTVVVPSNETAIPAEIKPIEKKFYAPWSAGVYFNGELRCIGVLLDRNWVLAESSCVDDLNWEIDVIYVLFGPKAALNIKAKEGQLIRVDCIRALKTGNVTFLHLANGVEFTRNTLPTFVPDSANDEDEDCVAVSHDPLGVYLSIPVKRPDANCSNCFEAAESIEHLQCDSSAVSKYGLIVCRPENGSYYPVSLFKHDDGLCLLANSSAFETLDKSYGSIKKITNWPFCDYVQPEADCEGIRCPLGKCIPPSLLCDGKSDCHDGSDEKPKSCKTRCRKDQLKCKNGKCIDKLKYCDTYDDCGDATDEPSECSCLNYLELTDPKKICDAKPNCEDKSDEPLDCKCRIDSFKCKSTKDCIPSAFVCDGQPDCPNGDDEKQCFAAEQPSDNSNKYYRVIERSNGEWQTKCIDKELGYNMNKYELSEVCRHFGFNLTKGIDHRLLDSITNQTHIQRNYQRNAIKMLPNIPKSTLKLNDNFNLTLFAPTHNPKPVKWDKIDEAKCYQLEVYCKN